MADASNTLDRPESEINRAIGARLTELGYQFSTQIPSDGSNRWWSLVFDHENSNKEAIKITVKLYFTAFGYIRFWTILDANKKLGDVEQVAIFQSVRDTKAFVRASIDTTRKNDIVTIECDLRTPSPEDVTKDVIGLGIACINSTTIDLLKKYDLNPIAFIPPEKQSSS